VAVKLRRVKKSIALNETPSQSYGVSLAIYDHSVICHPIQVSKPCLNLRQTGRNSIYLTLPYLTPEGWKAELSRVGTELAGQRPTMTMDTNID